MFNNPFQIALGIGLAILLIGLPLNSRAMIVTGMSGVLIAILIFLIQICILWREDRKRGRIASASDPSEHEDK